jgi:hypothetical protein
MHQLKLNISNQAYDSLIYIINSIPDIEILEDIKKDEEFKIDKNHYLKTLDKINKKDNDFKSTTAKQLFEDLDF